MYREIDKRVMKDCFRCSGTGYIEDKTEEEYPAKCPNCFGFGKVEVRVSKWVNIE